MILGPAGKKALRWLIGSPFGAVGKTENNNKETAQAWRHGVSSLTFAPQLAFLPHVDHKAGANGSHPRRPTSQGTRVSKCKSAGGFPSPYCLHLGHPLPLFGALHRQMQSLCEPKGPGRGWNPCPLHGVTGLDRSGRRERREACLTVLFPQDCFLLTGASVLHVWHRIALRTIITIPSG